MKRLEQEESKRAREARRAKPFEQDPQRRHERREELFFRRERSESEDDQRKNNHLADFAPGSAATAKSVYHSPLNKMLGKSILFTQAQLDRSSN